MLAAVVHLLGALATIAVILFVSGCVDGYFSRKRAERVFDTASIKLNLPRDGVFAGDYDTELSTYLADRYDADRVANRISDVGRPLFIALEFASYAVQMVIVAVVAWLTIMDDPSFAPAVWLAVVAAMAFWLINVAASGMLYVLTGRAPGEARDARALALKLRSDQNRSPTSSLTGPGKS